MSASVRPSNRVVEHHTNDLVSAPESPDSGADGSSLLAHHHARTGADPRVSRHQLARLKSSLSDRERQVLAGLRTTKFATARQIERLHYHGINLTPLSAARTSRRELAKLHEDGLLDRLERRIGGIRAGSGSFIYTLSPLGSRLLGETTRRRSREPSLAHLDHVLQVSELIVQLHELARTGQIDLLNLESEPDCWRPVIGPHGARLTLKPDLRVTIGAGYQELHWFIEIDRGTEHRPVLSRKCALYVGTWRDGREQAQASVFPRILWVVPDQERADVIQSVVTAMRTVPAGMFLTAIEPEAVTVLTGTEATP